MFCQKCGGKLAEGDRFCTFCGAKASLPEVPLKTSEPINMEMSAEPVKPAGSLVLR